MIHSYSMFYCDVDKYKTFSEYHMSRSVTIIQFDRVEVYLNCSRNDPNLCLGNVHCHHSPQMEIKFVSFFLIVSSK